MLTFVQRLSMYKHLVVMVAMFVAINASAQQAIKIEDLSKHVGDSVTVCTKIYGGIFLERSNGTPTLLNAGAAYPNSPLTLLIRPDARGKFKEVPELYYKDKEVCITGTIILYKEKPEIIIYDEKQIVVNK